VAGASPWAHALLHGSLSLKSEAKKYCSLHNNPVAATLSSDHIPENCAHHQSTLAGQNMALQSEVFEVPTLALLGTGMLAGRDGGILRLETGLKSQMQTRNC
jgi:hypothetical protein